MFVFLVLVHFALDESLEVIVEFLVVGNQHLDPGNERKRDYVPVIG